MDRIDEREWFRKEITRFENRFIESFMQKLQGAPRRTAEIRRWAAISFSLRILHAFFASEKDIKRKIHQIQKTAEKKFFKLTPEYEKPDPPDGED